MSRMPWAVVTAPNPSSPTAPLGFGLEAPRSIRSPRQAPAPTLPGSLSPALRRTTPDLSLCRYVLSFQCRHLRRGMSTFIQSPPIEESELPRGRLPCFWYNGWWSGGELNPKGQGLKSGTWNHPRPSRPLRLNLSGAISFTPLTPVHLFLLANPRHFPWPSASALFGYRSIYRHLAIAPQSHR